MAKSNFRALVWPLAIILSVVLVDQFTKLWAIDNLTLQPSKQIIGNLLMFTLVYNDGGALGTSFGPSFYYLISSSIILLFVLFYLYQNRFHGAISLPLAFIAGGAIGNITDRLRLGHVVDFIDVDMPDISLFGYRIERWWTFNIADAAISCSIVFLLVYVLIVQKKHDASGTDTPLSVESESENEFSYSPESRSDQKD